MSGFFVPTKFIWRFGGQQVHLCGSFTRWVETVPMAPVEGSPGVFAVIVHLPPGYHQYKFIVDGEWRHDETQPFMPDPLGNVNNWLFVRRPEAQQQPLPGLPGVHVSHPGQHSQSALHALHPHLAQQQHQQQAQQQQAAQQAQAQAQAQQPMAQQGSGSSGGGPSQPATPTNGADIDMQQADGGQEAGVLAPIVVQADDPQYTRKKIRDFLLTHTAYELIPESGKVVLLDCELPVRQAFHALHEQGIASAPLWDSESSTITGMISASDFIQVLKRLRNSVSSGANPMSEAEMDQHTIRGMREEAAAEARDPKQLVYVRPQDHLGIVIQRLFLNRCSMAPILSCEPGSGEVCTMLHISTISGVLACLMRHFRASLASLPLLAQPLGSLPVGTWSESAQLVQQEAANGPMPEGEERVERRKVRRLHTVRPDTLLTTALSLLLEGGCSALPVVDEAGALLDLYARADITNLAKSNAYNRLQWEDVTVGQALTLGSGAGSEGMGGGGNKQRVHMCTARDSLKSLVDRLSVPGVRRLIIVDSETRHVEGLVSLSDLAAYLLM